ncbi:hypothetical protein ZWY2020_054156 [Hordeum vulgare]|uniref:Histidine-containing phosphotransfer protein n=1 Tax=Hordeum vulgare subsp. vulgare TaxID=112509 RepID=F2EK33_HORVV|nr:hypothetical protein ZWY2020_054156 [Hordeum vulgare]BAK07705.1 predicted protein [Hordeum vulgare subsp. vulgare]
MAAAAIRSQINMLIATMFNTGLVDEAFLQLQRMRQQGRVTPAYVVEVINHFLNDADKIINDIAGLMNETEVEFDRVDALVHQLKATTSSIGAKRLNLCCVQHFKPEAKTKEGYLNALGRVRFQFNDLRSMFKIITELEQHFAALGPK